MTPLRNHRTLILASAALTLSPINAAVTTGYDFYTDASLDTDGDNRWEDLTAGNPSGFDFQLDNSPAGEAVTRINATTSYPGITHAYDFQGGFTGNEGGARLADTGGATFRSFQNAPDDWTNENVTIEIWFRPASLSHTPTNGQILFEDGGGTGFGFFLNDEQIQLRKAPNTGIVSSNISSIANEFIQVVGTFDTTGLMELYVNGVSVGTDNPAGNDWSGGDAAGVGTRGASNVGGLGNNQQNTESFDGEIAIFRLYRDQILTAPEVLDNYNAIVPEPSATLLVGFGLLGLIGRRRR